jgi:Protein of unknown function (DUF3072)
MAQRKTGTQQSKTGTQQSKTGTQQSPALGNVRKDPEEWTTGDEPMTAAQHSYLQTLCDEAGEPMDETLTKAQASERIAALQRHTGRGTAGQEQQC